MPHLFRGTLCGYLCPQCPEPLSNVVVRLYRLDDEPHVDELVAANPKDTLRRLSDDEVERKSGRLLAELRTDDDGAFTLDDVPAHVVEGGAVEVDVRVETVRGLQGDPGREPVQFTVTALRPEFVQDGRDLVATWHYCIAARIWCALRALFGAWTICGRVTDCETGVGIAGATVTAFDTDWFQHDDLGSAVTDGTGHFRIDYTASDFKETPFPFIDVEWVGGPDLFFKVEVSGNVVLDEDPSRGRQPDRENAGPCTCIDLCIDGGTPPDNPWFTHIGNFHILADIDPTTGLTNKAFDGAGGPGFGFYDSVKLKGYCPKQSQGATPEPMRYRFLYVHPDDPGTPVPITGDSMVDKVIVGSRLIQWKVTADAYEWTFQTIEVDGSGATPAVTPEPAGPGPWGAPPAHVIVPDAQGWVEVDQSSLDGGFYGPLLRFDTRAAVPFGQAPGDGAGNAVSDPRDGAGLTLIYEAGPTSGGATHSNQADLVYVNNWIEVRQLDLTQFSGPGGTPCSPLSTALDVEYAVDHELLRSWTLAINSASGSAPGTVIPPAPGGATARGHAGVHSENISGWASCSYRVTLSTQRRLTDGELDDDGDSTLITFCK